MARYEAINKMMKKTNLVNTARGVIYNKYVLYAVFFAALFDLLYSAVKQDYMYCILFILLGFIIAFFNKNMTVILTLTMAFANILRSVLNGTGMKVEGFGTEDTDTTKKSSDEKENMDNTKESSSNAVSKNDNDKNAKKEKMTSNGNTSSSSNSVSSSLMSSLKEQALDLQDAQKEIIKGFQQIEPHMDRAEGLIGSIQETAQTIQGMKGAEGLKV